MNPSSGSIVPSGPSQVTSRTLLAFASARRAGSATIQSSLHQPVSGTPRSSHRISIASPSRVTATAPAWTSAGFHEIVPPWCIVTPSRSQSNG